MITEVLQKSCYYQDNTWAGRTNIVCKGLRRLQANCAIGRPARRGEDKYKGIGVWHFEGIRVEFDGVSGLRVLLGRLWASETFIGG